MHSLHPRWMTAAKILLILPLFATVTYLIGEGSSVAFSLPAVLRYVGIGAVVLLIVGLPGIVLSLTTMQWALREGGTDSQWFWFSSEPPGLMELREDARRESKSGHLE